MTIKKESEYKSFGGLQKQYSHSSHTLDCTMRFAIFLPPNATKDKPVPVIYWLSGLTCTDENFTQKAGAQRIAAKLGLALVAPDTSPRGDDVPDADTYDLGQGASFYVNATQEPWNAHYKMYDYVLNELPKLVEANFPVSNKRAITGHSMGGHGALVLALRNPERFSSVSAFSPICNPASSPWGQKAFSAYLGTNEANWGQYDASQLMREATTFIPAMVSQGGSDEFLIAELKTERLATSAELSGFPLQITHHDGYDHSYYFIGSFIEEHLQFHAQHLAQSI